MGITATVSFGQLLRDFRINAGLSQETLAELARMSTGGIGVLERGIRRAPQRQTVELLADALKLSSAERERFAAAAERAKTPRRARSQEPARAPRHNLPYALTSFVGRQRAVSALSADVVEHRLVTVTGTGGVGKTRLALETAHTLLDTFADGVWFVELAPLADDGLVAQRVAETLGVRAAEPATNDEWMDALAGKHLLVILDNCEHLLAACADVARRMLMRCPRVHVVATSRERLHVIGERIYSVTPLQESAAVELFLDRAANASPEFSTADADTRRDVARICKQLDGIPFAVELAAARVSTMSVRMIAECIAERLGLLRLRQCSSTVSRHETMHALFDWSYDLLPDAHRRAFEDLSIFQNGCTLDDALNVRVGGITERAALIDVLSSLVDKSLAVADFYANDARYTLLETTREYARGKLSERGKLDEVAHRHASAYLSLAQRLRAEWNISPNRAWYDRSRSELENWRIAVHWTIGERHDVLLGQQLICALEPVWGSLELAEGLKWCRYALELVDEATPRAVVADLDYVEALLAFLAGDLKLALRAAQRALEECQMLDDQRGIAKAETIVGRVLSEWGKYPEGEAALAHALSIALYLDDPLVAATAHYGLGLSRSAAGDLEGAKGHVDEAFAIANARSAERIAAVAAMVSAEAHFRAGDKDATMDLAENALRSAREIGDDVVIMRALTNLATYMNAYGRYDEARDSAREALDFSYLAQGAAMVNWALQHLAVAAAARGDLTKAAHLFGYTGSRLSKLSTHGDYSDKWEREHLQAMLERALAPRELETLTSSGASMTESDAIAEAVQDEPSEKRATLSS